MTICGMVTIGVNSSNMSVCHVWILYYWTNQNIFLDPVQTDPVWQSNIFHTLYMLYIISSQANTVLSLRLFDIRYNIVFSKLVHEKWLCFSMLGNKLWTYSPINLILTWGQPGIISGFERTSDYTPLYTLPSYNSAFKPFKCILSCRKRQRRKRNINQTVFWQWKTGAIQEQAQKNGCNTALDKHII